MKDTQFKKTEIGLIPKDWNVKTLASLGKPFTGLSGKSKEDFGSGKPYIPYKNIFFNNRIDMTFLDYVEIGENENQFKVKYGDLFFTTSSETAAEVGMASVLLDHVNELFLNSFCFGFRLANFDVLDPHFASYLFRGRNIRKGITMLAQGSTRFNLSKSELGKLLIPIPSLPEQKAIAKILATCDDAIKECSAIMTQLYTRKRSVAWKLLFDKGEAKGAEKSIVLSKLLTRVKLPVSIAPQTMYKQIGIRSHAKGIFYKEPVSGASLGNKSVFHVEPDCFVVNIVFAWEHAIAKTTKDEVGMIASHRFPMYKPIEGKLDLGYLLHFFKSTKGKDLLALASPGGAGRNKTLGQSEFLKLQIPVPKIEVQRKIAQCLDLVDEEIAVYKNKLSALQDQKKGLMQQLLTGKVRVKIK